MVLTGTCHMSTKHLLILNSLVFIILGTYIFKMFDFPLMPDLRSRISKTQNDDDQKYYDIIRIMPNDAQLYKSTKQAITTNSWLGDSYGSEEPLYARSTCPTPLQNQLGKLDWPGGKFLPSVPVLLWSQHATPEVYARLAPHHRSMGWYGRTLSDVSEALQLLKEKENRVLLDLPSNKQPQDNHCITCAVVGNGGILRKSAQGKNIDAHDYVFRMNAAIIKGYEQDVGTRTTHYFFSRNGLGNAKGLYRKAGFTFPPISNETRYVFIPVHDKDYYLVKAVALNRLVDKGPDISKSVMFFFGTTVNAKKIKMMHPDFLRYLRNRIMPKKNLAQEKPDIYRPSTGAVAIFAALYSCDKVSILGFLTENSNNFSSYYFDRTYSKYTYPADHSFTQEKTLWKRLHDAGVLQLFTRSDAPVWLANP
uniref:alpha-N-acetylgalactosaminide alpha-2,6-sialyltransferase 2-like isoform X1 n=2 Tax=Myxine glutinosa TaxID=7769 RepID=UPI0035900074